MASPKGKLRREVNADLIPTKTLFEAFVDFNLYMATAPDEVGLRNPQQHFQDWHIEGIGFGLPEKAPSYVSSLGKWDTRLNLLVKRYVQPDFWDMGISQMRQSPKLRKASKNSLLSSHTVMFFRQGKHDPDDSGTPRSYPDGGGCLIALVFTMFGPRKGVHVFARASETIKALAGDLYFVRYLVRRAMKEAELPWDPEEMHIRWTATYGVQKDYFFPLLLQETFGDEYVRDFFTSEYNSAWRRFLHRYFWRFTLFPERVKWPPRRRPSELFLRNATLDWQQIGHDTGQFDLWPPIERKHGKIVKIG